MVGRGLKQAHDVLIPLPTTFHLEEQYRFWFLSKVKSWYATRLFGWMMAYSLSSKCIWRKSGVRRVGVLAKCSTSHFSSWAFQIVFWLKQPFPHCKKLTQHFPFLSVFLFLPFPYGFKTSKHAWFSFMLFCTASLMQKNDLRCDAQTSVFLTPKTLFYTIPLWLVLFSQPWLRKGKRRLLRSTKKWSTSCVFPFFSHRKAH